MAQRGVLGEEVDKGGLGIQAESVVVQIDRIKIWEGEQGGEEMGKSGWDLI